MLASHGKKGGRLCVCLKNVLRLEAICMKLANEEPHNKEEWRSKARVWHQRAGQFVIEIFGDVAIPSEVQDSHPAQPSS
jgi:hypothetical protein